MSEGKIPNYRLFSLAAKNFRAFAWINIKMCFVFACLTFLICLFSGYNGAISTKSEELFASSRSCNYLYCSSEVGKDVSKNATAVAEKLYPGLEWTKIKRYLVSDAVYKISKNKVSSSIVRYINFCHNGEELLCEDDTFTLSVYNSVYQFSDNDISEYRHRFDADDLLIGRMPQAVGEIVVSEDLLHNYGLDRSALGSDISLQITGAAAPFFSGKVVGIINSKFYTLAGHMVTSQIYPVTIMYFEEPIFSSGSCSNTIIAQVDDFLTETMVNDFRYYGINYGGTALVNAADLLDKITILANTLYVIIGSSLGVGLVLTIFLMIGKYNRIFMRSSGIYMTYGMPRSRIGALLACQLLLLAFVSIPLAFVLSAAGYFVIGRIILLATGISMDISMEKMLYMLALGIGVIILISMLFFVTMYTKTRKRSIRELLAIKI